MTGCDARLGWNTPTRTLLVDCGRAANHDGPHAGVWAHDFPGTDGTTTLTWLEADRRTFRGDFVDCPDRGCVLPAGHPRGHEQ